MSYATQRTQILAALSARGWVPIEILAAEWWADEILVLTSKWSPVGRRLVLTFLVDPQHDGPRAHGEDISAVVASPTPPVDRPSASGTLLSLGNGWQSRLPDFVRDVDALRERPS
jgi:hypothetical protein